MSFFPSSSPDRERVEPLTTAPDASKFVSLEEHQSSTPSSFYDAPPVLYHHAANCKLLISRRELANTPHMKELWSSSATDKLHSAECDGSHDADVDVVLDGVDVWVTSKRFLIYRQEAKAGLSIPYLSIKLHAVRSLSTLTEFVGNTQGLWLSFTTGDQNHEDEEEPITNMTLGPSQERAPEDQAAVEHSGVESTQAEETFGQKLYDAVTACSNLHPDPFEDGDSDEEGHGYTGITSSELFQQGLVAPGNAAPSDLPPSFPGSGGWITAENAHEHFDEEGNWKEKTVDSSVGTVRPRQQDDDGNDAGGDEDAKRQKTEE